MALSDDDVREILRIIDESDLAELKIETEAFSLHVVRGGAPAAAPLAPPPAAAQPAPPQPTTAPPPPPPAIEATPAGVATAPDNGLLMITAPMLGTFYRAESPGAPPFVDPGTTVEPDTIVCIIEVMKMMNSIPAGVSGIVTEVLAQNAELVEYGAPLFRVKPQ